LESLSDSDVNNVVGDFSVNFLHTSVSGAGTLGHLFGFEVGLLAGQGMISHTEDIVHRSQPAANADKVPHAALLGVLSVPLGITAEVSLVPKIGSEDFKFSSTGVAAKWTLTELWGDLPFSLAVKGSHTITRADFKHAVTVGNANYKLENGSTALIALISKNFILVEPYFGAGVVSSAGKLSSDNALVFDDPLSRSQKGRKSGGLWMAGAEVKLLVLKLGAEYTQALGASRYTGKLSFYF